MPFTLSHPAAVLPLLRRPWSAPALVAGAMAPDAPYFLGRLGIPVSAQSWYEPLLNATTSHAPLGALTVSLPLALLATALLLATAAPVRAALPASTAGLVPPRRPVPTALGWILLSCAVGIATHLAWDAVTHGDGWVVQAVPVLQAPTGIGDLSWARLLQHASTALGLVAIAWWLHARRSRLPLRAHPDEARRAAVAVVALVVVAAVGAGLGALPVAADGGGRLELLLSSAAKGAGLAVLIAAVTAVAAWWAARAALAMRRSRR
ncbi:DUF4184 family protein [Agrococcus terreus]|uniref:DUF4184 family protein n=1 Tax=Agrococcus terreus TaxID=574649 RepID=A0ABQ2KJR5_9MICO|nr:DUF4184 family protein [Agrococcus terreus]GGN84433.1 hypothetical protein GCM10010968_16130 [Agrococcus terreus]